VRPSGPSSPSPRYLEAAAAARRVAGVRNVRNHLGVVLPAADYRDDAWLTTAANNALTLNVTVPDSVEATARDGNLTLNGTVEYRRALVEDDSDISVNTNGNTVTLGGHVRTWAEHDTVVGAAWMAGGVIQVRDDLDVTG
jgi:osmotically-inducible protein OsmY